MLEFDEWGYIMPPEVHDLTLEEFERTFVIDAERERLFKHLLDLVNDLKSRGATGFYFWVDGSFVTKKRVPRDIDVVAFFGEGDIERMSDFLMSILGHYETELDIFFTTARDEWRWRELFITDRAGYSKGFIQINF